VDPSRHQKEGTGGKRARRQMLGWAGGRQVWGGGDSGGDPYAMGWDSMRIRNGIPGPSSPCIKARARTLGILALPSRQMERQGQAAQSPMADTKICPWNWQLAEPPEQLLLFFFFSVSSDPIFL